MCLHTPVADPNECAFPILRATHSDPPMSGGQTARLKWNDSYTRSPLRRYGYSVYDPLDDDIDAIGISGTDVVTKLGVTKKIALIRFSHGR
jgi:hypothetical protein